MVTLQPRPLCWFAGVVFFFLSSPVSVLRSHKGHAFKASLRCVFFLPQRFFGSVVVKNPNKAPRSLRFTGVFARQSPGYFYGLIVLFHFSLFIFLLTFSSITFQS